MNVLIVESPTKAKTISKYLGSNFKVVSSFGHVRDLPSKNGSVDPDNDFQVIYEVPATSEKHVKELVKAVKGTTNIYLATDPDREGEAIAWHIVEVLRERNAIKNTVNVNRIVFNEITESAVTKAVKDPRDIDIDLVNAQQTRRILDYLVGFTLSPVLWVNLPGSRSAGRVQSVALRILCDRENEIDLFKEEEYWSVHSHMSTKKQESFTAELVRFNNVKLEKFSIPNLESAQKVVEHIQNVKEFLVTEVKVKEVKRFPAPPFITSTLQQEASNKLGLSTRNVMSIAQKLYEGVEIKNEMVGLITYMRTDGFFISDSAIESIRAKIVNTYGKEYLPDTKVTYNKKVKNAQEAHEAIRPTDINRTPESVRPYLDDSQYKLYLLIWKRTIACQAKPAIFEQTSIDIVGIHDQSFTLRTNGSVQIFDGFYRIYGEPQDANQLLPVLKKGDVCSLLSVTPEQHFTQPPARYNEASLVKKMEEIGIGRPSTYANIIHILQERNYVEKSEQKRLVPNERGRVVVGFLINFFDKYVEYDFTANLEEKLDLIADHNADWKETLRDFWHNFKHKVTSVQQLSRELILDKVSDTLASHFFADKNGSVDRKCPLCKDGNLSINLGKNGVFIGCLRYPECRYTSAIGNYGSAEEVVIGIDQNTAQEITLKNGSYGYYLQLGHDGKKCPVPKEISIDSIDISLAQKILSLPILLGTHPDDGLDIKLGIGRFGAYLLYKNEYFSVKKVGLDIFNVDLAEALNIISKLPKKLIKILGKNGKTDKDVGLYIGKFGHYIRSGVTRVPLPKDKLSDDITLEYALELLKKKSSKKKN